MVGVHKDLVACTLSDYIHLPLDLQNEALYSCSSLEVFNAPGKNKRRVNILKDLLTGSDSLWVCIRKIHRLI